MMDRDRMAIARKLVEMGASVAQVADLGRWQRKTVESWAKRQAWMRQPATRNDLARRVRRHMEARLDKFDADEAAGVKLTAAQERARSEERMKMHQLLNRPGRQGEDDAAERIKKNADVAGALAKLEHKIVELAGGYAEHLVAAGTVGLDAPGTDRRADTGAGG